MRDSTTRSLEDWVNHVDELIVKENFEIALRVVLNILASGDIEKHPKSIFLKSKFLCLLIDIGCSCGNEEILKDAIKLWEIEEEGFKGVITKSSYYYNLANAKHGLAKIYTLDTKGNLFPSPKNIKEYLHDPINTFWLAYKEAINEKADINFTFQILINIGDLLGRTGRLIESIQNYDFVLKAFPKYPQANFNRAEALDHLFIANTEISIALFYEIYKGYEICLNYSYTPSSIKDYCEKGLIKYKSKIENQGFKFDKEILNNEVKTSNKQYLELSDYRKFCLDNFLTLSEHGIYCKCIASAKDDLQIGIQNAIFKTDPVLKMQLLLNRIKSEYSLARTLFYKSNFSREENKDWYAADVEYTDLLEDEYINPSTEMLRTSFRVCYGILDKIAKGICYTYDLTTGNDSKNILFESFWKSSEERWEKINSIRNIHLSALYSIASDFNTKKGEWKVFKDWRNKLEHGILILVDKKIPSSDPLKVYSDKELITTIDINEFKDKTLQLLQLTRSAIFSFVFCIRLQFIQNNDGSIGALELKPKKN